MREIKFRAAIKREGGEYDLVKFKLSDFIEPLWSIRELVIPFLKNGNIPDRYAGLNDKNDKEIYEGDIVKGIIRSCQESIQESPIKGEIKYKNGSFIISESEFFYCALKTVKEFSSETLEVLGNIYENPELLEKLNRRGI